jgi:hypothetical protein
MSTSSLLTSERISRERIDCNRHWCVDIWHLIPLAIDFCDLIIAMLDISFEVSKSSMIAQSSIKNDVHCHTSCDYPCPGLCEKSRVCERRQREMG